ncbi:hypothetical protein ACN23B_07965 [Anabaena sp. FACHB-709]|uniref:Uncharacterized protein n=1 Tax=Anabaena cylindrica FACHB-318 TaxID=2692880 RepID=A0ABR7ZPX3_ANACY|nr:MULTISPECIES: hypothetical protein [Nostocaceae]HBW31828.1 hypothetical protein [Nostoc sp. UBA8866]MBD2174547.1 hypothetical protein [Anabaena cylindrica FACHB-318]MBD2266299.1 hypothetical protein [Anabaena sp. FACHB-709]MBD2275723.1 hypothetical protein [Nostoc sp. PCC 7120 = FACHB-418]MBD2286626.1 hypothetical protein [Anabaena cylindrica FACHB-170]
MPLPLSTWLNFLDDTTVSVISRLGTSPVCSPDYLQAMANAAIEAGECDFDKRGNNPQLPVKSIPIKLRSRFPNSSCL